jgi:hypothetical protein
VSESEPEQPVEPSEKEPSPPPEGETPEQKRARVMARLAEIIRADPPDLSGSGPVSAGGFPVLPTGADDFDQESAAELFAALGQFFEKRKPSGRAGEPDTDPQEPEPEPE